MKKLIIFCLLASVLLFGCTQAIELTKETMHHDYGVSKHRQEKIRELIENCMRQASIPVIRGKDPTIQVSAWTPTGNFPTKEVFAHDWLDAYDLTPDQREDVMNCLRRNEKFKEMGH